MKKINFSRFFQTSNHCVTYILLQVEIFLLHTTKRKIDLYYDFLFMKLKKL